MTVTRYQTLWFRRGKLFLPSIGRTPSGMFFEVAPVKVLEPQNEVLCRELERSLSAPPQVVPDRPRYGGGWPTISVVQAAAGLESWSSFAKRALGIAIIETPAKWQLSAGKGTSQEDVENVELEKTVPLSQLADEVMALADRWPIWRR